MFPQYDTFRFVPMITSPTDITDVLMPLAPNDESTPIQILDDSNGIDSLPPQSERRSSSEEKDMTPAQSKRKAQNRAAYVYVSLLPKTPSWPQKY
jgi:hypothetical protein